MSQINFGGALDAMVIVLLRAGWNPKAWYLIGADLQNALKWIYCINRNENRR